MKEKGLAPLVNIANALSLLRIAITPLFVWILLFQQDYLLVGIMLFSLAAITDSCDGYLARRYHLVTELGNFLDPFADKVLVFSTFFAFYKLGFFPLWFVLLVITRDIMITVMRLVMVNKSSPLKTSNLGKWKTTMQILLIYGVFLQMLLKNYNFMPLVCSVVCVEWLVFVLMYLVAFMTTFSGVDYLFNVMRS